MNVQKQKKSRETVEHIVLECSQYEHERESFMDVIREQYDENQWNASCVAKDSGTKYLVGPDEKCNITIMDAMKNFLLNAWNRRH
ncbi:hypothetical protein FHG87_010238 [Trinorchestia longiramus]|nr:hypothetical protein FHG87_010238 [Trinorchestia longiramus]